MKPLAQDTRRLSRNPPHTGAAAPLQHWPSSPEVLQELSSVRRLGSHCLVASRAAKPLDLVSQLGSEFAHVHQKQ